MAVVRSRRLRWACPRLTRRATFTYPCQGPLKSLVRSKYALLLLLSSNMFFPSFLHPVLSFWFCCFVSAFYGRFLLFYDNKHGPIIVIVSVVIILMLPDCHCRPVEYRRAFYRRYQPAADQGLLGPRTRRHRRGHLLGPTRCRAEIHSSVTARMPHATPSRAFHPRRDAACYPASAKTRTSCGVFSATGAKQCLLVKFLFFLNAR
jgi:hypothetical protein